MSVFSPDEPRDVLQVLTCGSLANIFVLSGTRITFKTARWPEWADDLEDEYDAHVMLLRVEEEIGHCSLINLNTPVSIGSPQSFVDYYETELFLIIESIFQHMLGQVCNTDTFFCIPRALGFYDPATDTFVGHSSSSAAGSRDTRPALHKGTFAGFHTAVYGMDRIFDLPTYIGKSILSILDLGIIYSPRLCRFYFAEAPLDDLKRLCLPNFPFEVGHYITLSQKHGLDSIEAVTYGIGEMLGQIHWHGGFDAKGVEFVIGGNGVEGCNFYVIDFEKMSPWSKTIGSITQLVEAFYHDEEYFPQPRSNNNLYKHFKRGYLSAYPPECVSIAEAFLAALEIKHAKPTSRVEQGHSPPQLEGHDLPLPPPPPPPHHHHSTPSPPHGSPPARLSVVPPQPPRGEALYTAEIRLEYTFNCIAYLYKTQWEGEDEEQMELHDLVEFMNQHYSREEFHEEEVKQAAVSGARKLLALTQQ